MSDLIIHAKRPWRVTKVTASKLEAVPAASGAELAAIRARLGLTTRAMAERLGISQSKLVKLENDQLHKALPAVLTAAQKITDCAPEFSAIPFPKRTRK